MKKIIVLLFIAVAIYSNEVIYVDPVNGAKLINPENNITVGFKSPVNFTESDINSSLIVTGSVSGIHNGSVKILESGKKFIFKPEVLFTAGENISVKFTGVMSKMNNSGSKIKNYSFSISKQKLFIDPMKTLEKETGINFQQYQLPLSPPVLNVAVNNSPAPGKLFFAPLTGYESNNTILNADGSVFWYHLNSANTFDFKKQPNGNITYFEYNPPRFTEINSEYTEIHTYSCGNGYITDTHELKVLPNGHALIMAYDPQVVDMSLIIPGGHVNASVIGLIVQEIDQQNNVLFQWRSWDHMQITDATQENLLDSVIDYVHGNAIEPDNDGNLLISSRHLDEITKINKTTGAIIWRLGGKNNMFTINDDIPFSHQHDIRRISNGNITFFDNGNFRFPEYSRAVEYSLDETNHIATRVWQFHRDPQAIASWGGNVQRLPNGNTLIAWGGCVNTVTEVKHDGTVVFDGSYSPGIYTYRGYKYDWDPSLVGINSENNTPLEFKLMQNYPNPFNPETNIKFLLNKSAETTVKIYDINGKEVMNCFSGFLNAGSHTIKINGSSLSSGVYIYKLVSGKYQAAAKMILIK